MDYDPILLPPLSHSFWSWFDMCLPLVSRRRAA